MWGSKKSKRITWAPDVSLCQVRLFSSAKPPSEVGVGCLVDLDVPPGFEKPSNLKLPRIPCKRWRCPARMELNIEWQMVAGEESKEVEAQKQRERRVLEAVFPRPSAIPPNPRLPVNAQESIVDDQSIPPIPITLEEAEALNASAMNIPQQPQNQVISSRCDGNISPEQPQNQVISSRCDGNISPEQPQNQVISSQCDGNISVEGAKPASESFVSNGSNQDQTNLIDADLLMIILNNPILVQQLLISTRQEPSAQNTPNPELQPNIPSDSAGIPINGHASIPTTTTKVELNAPTTATTPPAAPFCPPQLGTGFVSTSGPSPPVVKDINYYKSLIQQHGGGGGGGGGVLPQSCSQSNRLMGGAAQEFRKPRDPTKSRIMKPCIFFNSNRGCKNGANCAYQHDIFASQKRAAACATEVFAKRIKLDR